MGRFTVSGQPFCLAYFSVFLSLVPFCLEGQFGICLPLTPRQRERCAQRRNISFFQKSREAPASEQNPGLSDKMPGPSSSSPPAPGQGQGRRAAGGHRAPCARGCGQLGSLGTRSSRERLRCASARAGFCPRSPAGVLFPRFHSFFFFFLMALIST